MAFKCKAEFIVRPRSQGRWSLCFRNANGGVRFIEEFSSEYAAQQAKVTAEREARHTKAS